MSAPPIPARARVDMLTLDRPELDWVEMARGMGVEGCRVQDAPDLADALSAGLASAGPYLVEVML